MAGDIAVTLMTLKPIRKREFPMYYAKGKKLFHIIVHISDAPGSLRGVLDLLGARVNLVGTSTYSLGDGTAMLSAFAESLSQADSPGAIQKLLGSSSATIESEVREGQDGILVDTFHSGLQVGSEDYMLLRRGGLSGVFDHIVKIFGTGGEVLLYEEGSAMARENASKTQTALTLGVIKGHMSYLIKFLAAQGWGTIGTVQGKGENEYTVTTAGCFECASGSAVRKKCDFVRGYFEGSGTVTLGVPMQCDEVECTLRGNKACVFHIFPRKGK